MDGLHPEDYVFVESARVFVPDTMAMIANTITESSPGCADVEKSESNAEKICLPLLQSSVLIVLLGYPIPFL